MKTMWNVGKASTVIVKKLAEAEYEKFAPFQDRNYVSDFDREIKKLKDKK